MFKKSHFVFPSFSLLAVLMSFNSISLKTHASPTTGKDTIVIKPGEYTHLLHKLWAADHRPDLSSFRDSILWECLYEGVGMYRSLHPKWMPAKGELPVLSKNTLEKLYPIFVDRLIKIETADSLSAFQKEELNKNLSGGNVTQKWGAFPMAIWLAMEANGDDSKLRAWINQGPVAVIQLAKKYLPADLKQKFSNVFP